jgi:hypothetical protein
VIRHEDPLAKLTTLDVQSATSIAATWAIEQVLSKLQADEAETEYAERDGILVVPRIVPDIPINEFKAAESGKGLELTVQGLHATKPQVRLQAEKIGTLQSLTWSETAVDEVPMEPGMVEIEVMAVGVNFKVPSPPQYRYRVALKFFEMYTDKECNCVGCCNYDGYCARERTYHRMRVCWLCQAYRPRCDEVRNW